MSASTEKVPHVCPKHIRQCLLGLAEEEDCSFQHVALSSSREKIRDWLSASSAGATSSSSVPSAGDLAEALLFSDMTPQEYLHYPSGFASSFAAGQRCSVRPRFPGVRE